MNSKGRIEKSVHTREYATCLRLLRESREKAEITQVQMAQKIGLTQSLYSKIERGERRLDIIELRTILKHLGISLNRFVDSLESELNRRR